MFRWYRNATVCYSFLSDVTYELGPDDHAFLTCSNEERLETSQQPAIVKALRSSKWFRRGWTLQELIAPVSVHFYSKQWRFLGSKLGDRPGTLRPDRFPELISNITGIDIDVLKGRLGLEELSVASRYAPFTSLLSRVLLLCRLGSSRDDNVVPETLSAELPNIAHCSSLVFSGLPASATP
jgi:hypothetical protein